MFDKETFAYLLDDFKKNFNDEHWQNESYKWLAINHFQKHWNNDAADFADMLKNSLEKCGNLLTSNMNYPALMITEFAKDAPEHVRKMFYELYDERTDVWTRIRQFKNKAGILLDKYKENKGQHYQGENAITTYLWLRYPDKYYIYKFSCAKDVSKILGVPEIFKKGQNVNNVNNFYRFYKEINREISLDQEIKSILKKYLNQDTYRDDKLVTLTIDFGYYLSRYYNHTSGNCPESSGWWPEKYDPGLTREDWIQLLKDPEIFNINSLALMKRMKDIGGCATCKQLELKYGNSPQSYNLTSTQLAKRIQQKTACPLLKRYDGKDIFWTLLYTGKIADDETPGEWVWKLREPLSHALDEMDLSSIPLHQDDFQVSQENELPSLPNGKNTQADDNEILKPYTKQDFLKELFLDSSQYEALTALLRRKKNLILQGAPGVGKTFTSKRLAYAMMGKIDDERIKFVQFHQGYSYEDFMLGYRPCKDGFVLKHGVFYEFCHKAAQNPDQEFFFIIDEINRGNLSRIFGELLMLIEGNHRDKSITLGYNCEEFSVPTNLFLIGMMNTADRSLAMIDYALRRRFGFFTLKPAFETDKFKAMQAEIANAVFDEVIAEIKQLNLELENDPGLGPGFCIGHSHFCKDDAWQDAKKRAQEVIEYEILPLLEEYWFDEREKLSHWQNRLRGIFKD